ncbi:hypothetical protein H8B01_20085 [Bradyrhizobium sp. Cham227]|nr:hypothetical protein [Bradyrhizobium brasilense]
MPIAGKKPDEGGCGEEAVQQKSATGQRWKGRLSLPICRSSSAYWLRRTVEPASRSVRPGESGL